LDINSGKIRGITVYRFGGAWDAVERWDRVASLHCEGNGETGVPKKAKTRVYLRLSLFVSLSCCLFSYTEKKKLQKTGPPKKVPKLVACFLIQKNGGREGGVQVPTASRPRQNLAAAPPPSAAAWPPLTSLRAYT
jgi:hypothetical protein